MTEPRKDLGENDVNFTDVIGDVAEKAADSFACAPSAGRAICVDLAHGHALRCLRHPSDIGLDYEETFFPSVNGIPLEAWFIRANSDKLLIVNHPMTCNRYGFPGHCLLGIRCLAVLALDACSMASLPFFRVLPNATRLQRSAFGLAVSPVAWDRSSPQSLSASSSPDLIRNGGGCWLSYTRLLGCPPCAEGRRFLSASCSLLLCPIIFALYRFISNDG
jgi:hypothetical protein